MAREFSIWERNGCGEVAPVGKLLHGHPGGFAALPEGRT